VLCYEEQNVCIKRDRGASLEIRV